MTTNRSTIAKFLAAGLVATVASAIPAGAAIDDRLAANLTSTV